MSEPYTIYSVGQLFDPQKRRWDEGAMYSYHQDMHQVLIFFADIRSFERKAVERGLAHFGLFVEDDVIMLLFKMDGDGGKGGVDWHYAPYSWHLVPEEARTLPTAPEDIPDDLGVLVTIFLIDAATGIIRAMRALNLSHDFTQHLHRAIREQAARPFDRQRYMDQVRALRQRFPTVRDMVEAAQATCLGGIYEGPAGA